jgi:hypothetical protein
MKKRTRTTRPRAKRTSLRGTRAQHGDAAEVALAALKRHLEAGECFKSALELGTAWTQIDEGYRMGPRIPRYEGAPSDYPLHEPNRGERMVSEKRSDEQSERFARLADKFKRTCLIRR